MKKRMIRKFLPALLCLCLLVALTAVTAFAADPEPSSVFDASTEIFTINGVELPKTDQPKPYPDMFPDMKGLMPGDKVVQEISVQVKNAGSNTVRLTLQAEDTEDNPTDQDFDRLMAEEGVTLTVEFEGKSYTGLLSEIAATAEDGAAAAGIPLGSYTYGANAKTMTATLEIPLTAGNGIQDLFAHLGWVIRAEIIPGGGGDDPTPTPKPTPIPIPTEEPEPPEEEEDFEEGDVPLSGLSEDEEDFGNEDVPLANLPQTGLLWWPVPVLICVGAALLIVGAVRRKKNED